MPPRIDYDKIYTPSAPLAGPPPSPEIFIALREEGFFGLCRDFYAELEHTPLRSMFPDNMATASEKLACFLIGLCGGPPLYHERYGPPRMRARHLPFEIDSTAQRHWMDAFKRALEHAPTRHGFPTEHLPGFVDFLERFSAWMVNRAPGSVTYPVPPPRT